MAQEPTSAQGAIARGTDQDFAPVRAARAPVAPAAFHLDLNRAYAMHRKLAWTVGAAVFALIVLYGLTRPKKYESEVVFYVSPVQRDVLATPGTQPGYDESRYTATVQQLSQTMQRMDVAQAAVRTLPEGVWRKRGEPVAAAAARLIAGLTVQRSGTSFQVTADLDGSDAEGTAAALNALTKAFLAQVKAEQNGASAEQVALLKAEQERVSEELTRDREEQVQLSAALGVARLDTQQGNPMDSVANDMRRQLMDVQHAQEMAVLQPSGGGGQGEGTSTTGGLISSLNTRKAQLQSQMAGMTAANPIYQQDLLELAQVERELVETTARAARESRERESQRQQLLKAQSQSIEAQLRAQLQTQTVLASKSAPQLQQYAQLSSAIDRLQSRSNAIDEALRSLMLEQSGSGQVRVVLPATVPTGPQPGKRKLLLIAALPLGLLAGALAAVFARNRDRRLFLGRDVEQVLGFRPMVVLPAATEVSAPVREAYLLRLAAAIENSYRSGARSFVFTAPSVKTEIEDLIFELQKKLKDLGYSALWVGSDTLLRAERDFEEAYGRGPTMGEDARMTDNGVDGLAAARLAWLKRDYDMVLVDAPPLTCSGEAEYAVRRCDATILVNESGVTTRDDLQQAAEILERIGLGGVGAVVKDLRLSDADVLFQHSVRMAEADHARRVQREPRDNAGTWQILHQGTSRELVVPGDPLARQRRRARPDRTVQTRIKVS